MVVAWTVLISVVVHGLSATPAARAYGRWWTAMNDEHADEMEHMAEAMPMEEQRIRGG